MEKIIREFVRRSMHTQIAGYSEDELDAKRMWHLQGRRILMHIAAKMGLTEDEYEISNNYAGPAVSGEITLHTDFVYIQFSQSSLGPDWGFMWRSCNGRKDYTGGPNRWMQWPSLYQLNFCVKEFLSVRTQKNV
jgi:hypothetical protein